MSGRNSKTFSIQKNGHVYMPRFGAGPEMGTSVKKDLNQRSRSSSNSLLSKLKDQDHLQIIY